MFGFVKNALGYGGEGKKENAPIEPPTDTAKTLKTLTASGKYELLKYSVIRGEEKMKAVGEPFDALDFYDYKEDNPSKRRSKIYAKDADCREHCVVFDSIDYYIDPERDGDVFFDWTNARFSFNHVGDDGSSGIYQCCFPSVKAMEAFAKKYQAKLKENMPEEDRAIYWGALDARMDVDPDPRLLGPQQAPGDRPRNGAQATHAREGAKDAYRLMEMGGGGKDRSYAVHGNTLDVFRNRAGGLEDTGLQATLTHRAAKILPTVAMLHDVEQQMLMLGLEGDAGYNGRDPYRTHNMYKLDLQKEVVSEYKFKRAGVDVSMLGIDHEFKGAGLAGSSTLLGLDKNALGVIDLRDPSGLVADWSSEKGKVYAKEDFTCMKATGDGRVVTGDSKGQLRLYNRTGIKAQTTLPNAGARLTALDVTFDGRWIVATADRFLVLVCTAFLDKNGQEKSGFAANGLSPTSTVEATTVPPIYLRLRPEDVAKVGDAPFRSGRFEWITEQGKSESWIVASRGAYTFAWNIEKARRRERRGNIEGAGQHAANTDYECWAREGRVVDSNFMHGRYKVPNKGAVPLVIVTEDVVFGGAGADDE